MFSYSLIYANLILLLSFGFLPSIVAAQNSTEQVTFEQITPSKSLKWYPCYGNYECAQLDVPLDYSQLNGTRASVPVIKIPAQLNGTDDKYQGIILTNPGGPGNSGVNWILNEGYSTLFPVVPKSYDLVSWEPRGMGYSTPYTDCGLQGLTAKSKRAYGISGPEVSDSFYNGLFQEATGLGYLCESKIGGPNGVGAYMSTPVVARDMISIIDAFAETEQGKSVDSPKLVNYWGFSYGTVIGETFASMFPDRVGRYVLDGVVDASDILSSKGFSLAYYTDAVVDLFFEYCFRAGPSLCPFYTGTSSKDIKTRFLNLFANFEVEQAYAQKWANATVLDQSLGSILTMLRTLAYSPLTQFPQMAQTLVAYEQALSNLTVDNIDAAGQAAIPVKPVVSGVRPELIEWGAAVFCSDSGGALFNKTLEDYRASNKILLDQTYIGHVGWDTIKIFCSGWSIKAKEVFTGQLGASTKRPILFVSNTIDPATPIENSKRLLPKYKDSQLLTIDAAGHCSFAAKNSCANAKIHNFFKTGQLPGTDNFCAAEVGPFGVTLKDLKSYLPSANFTLPVINSTDPGGPSTTAPPGTPTTGPASDAALGHTKSPAILLGSLMAGLFATLL